MKKTLVITSVVLILGLIILLSFAFSQDMMKKSDDEARRPARVGMARMGRPEMRGMGMAPHLGMMGNPGMLMRLADKLELSEGQRNEIKDMLTNNRKSMIRSKADIEVAKVDLQRLMDEREPDLGAIKNKINDIASLEAEAKFSQIKFQVEVKNVLTKEQHERLKELMKDGQTQMMRGRMGMRRGRPGKTEQN